MKKKYALLFLILIFLLTNILFVNAEEKNNKTDNTNMGSAGEDDRPLSYDMSTFDMDIDQTDISIARISLYNGETKEKIDSFIVSNYYDDDFKEVRLMTPKMAKTDYINLNGNLTKEIIDFLENEDEYIKLSDVKVDPNFPQLLIRSLNQKGAVESVREYFNDYKKVQFLINSFKIKDNYENLVLLIEPMAICKYNINDETIMPEDFEYSYILLTFAEAGLLLYNNHLIVNTYIYSNQNGIMPFKDYYHKQLYIMLPFSCFKIDKEKLDNIKPCDNKYKNSWTITNNYLDMINSLGCFEVYWNIATKSEIVATQSDATKATESEIEPLTHDGYILFEDEISYPYTYDDIGNQATRMLTGTINEGSSIYLNG